MRSRWGGLVSMVVGSVLLLLPVLSARPAAAQALPEFEVDAVTVRAEQADGRVRLDLYTRIPYANLRFLNTAGGFRASYTVTAELYDVDERGRRLQIVQSRFWDREVQVESFSATRAAQLSDLSTHSLSVEPGRYRLLFQVEDQASREAFELERDVEVRPLRGPVAISDLILLDDFDEASNTISPRVSARVGSDEGTLQLFCELYADRADQQVQIKREVVRTRKTSSGPSPVRTLFNLMRDLSDEDDAEVVHTETTERRLERDRTPVVSSLPLDDLPVGEYLVRVAVKDAQGRLLDVVARSFDVYWSGLAAHVRELDEAIEQLQYIAKGRELQRIREASSYRERLRRFREFWERRDPTPSTRRNERMEEYYYRVDFANRSYGPINGWKTDRGLVFVRFGEPDRVEQHLHEDDADPYEVWYYSQIGKRFVFVDRSGAGNFELLVPIWDERNRIR